MNHFVEIRSYNLKPGKREEFRRFYIEEALPLLKRWNFDVVAIMAGLKSAAVTLSQAGRCWYSNSTTRVPAAQ
jgi:hypothetical protein